MAKYFAYGRPQYTIYYGHGGYGDDLLLTTVLHELRERGYKRLAAISRRPELYENSPDVDAVIPDDWGILGVVERFGGKHARAYYYSRLEPPETDIPSTSHILTEMCRTAGLSGTVRLRPYFYLTDKERADGRIVNRQAVIQCPGPKSENLSPLKLWPQERYQSVVDLLKDDLQFVQLGSLTDPPLNNVLDLRGQTSLRQSAGILANSMINVSYVGFLMHLARAVECRSVVIFGGREHPDFSGYPCNENLHANLPCSPCWRRSTCDWGLACMDSITSDDAVNAVRKLLSRGASPLEAESAVIPNFLVEYIPPPYVDPRC